MFSICWGIFLSLGAFFSCFPMTAVPGQPPCWVDLSPNPFGADVTSVSCEQSDGAGSSLVQLDELCRTLMGNCSLQVLMNNGGKAAHGGVQTPSPFGMIFPPP